MVLVAIISLIIGISIGFIVTVYIESKIDKAAVESGIIKLDGEFYILEELYDK